MFLCPEILRAHIPSQLTKNSSQGIVSQIVNDFMPDGRKFAARVPASVGKTTHNRKQDSRLGLVSLAENGPHRQTFGVWIPSCEVGGLPFEGVKVRKFGMSLETKQKQIFWQGIPGKLPGYPGNLGGAQNL